jgi:small subunit ribosomal protein S7
MPRAKLPPRKPPAPDAKYNSVLLSRYVGKLMLHGKKERALNILYKALDDASSSLKMKPVEVLEAATETVRPLVEVTPKRIGGATYQIPTEVDHDKGITLAIRWIVMTSRKKKGAPMVRKLSSEFVDAIRKTGGAYKKREDMHRMAEANKAFSHFK